MRHDEISGLVAPQHRGGVEHIVVEGHAFAKPLCQSVEPGLMAEFIDRTGVGAEVVGNRSAEPGL